ncbi:MAG: hypothetical protein ACI4A8_10655 [Muribaculaceae bacterium]
MKHYQLDFTDDKRIRGRYNDPHTINIVSKEYIKYMSEKNGNMFLHLDNQETLYEEMPENIEGKLYKRNNVVDYMNIRPYYIGQVAVVSNKIKQIFERLNVPKNEYALKKISIKDFEDEFYILFVPKINDTEFVYPKCIFAKMFDNFEGITTIFNSLEEYYNRTETYESKKVTLKSDYKDYDILFPRTTVCPYFSERIINAFQQENVVGHEIVKGGICYTELDFD